MRFKYEKALWNANQNNLQQKLIRSNIRHSGNGLGQASTFELLTDGFSHYKKLTRKHAYYFNPEWIQKFIKQYNIISICDPFGYYGETVLSALATGKITTFVYNEPDNQIYQNTKSMLSSLGIEKSLVKMYNRKTEVTIQKQLSKYANKIDALFTCLYNSAKDLVDTDLLHCYINTLKPTYCAFVLLNTAVISITDKLSSLLDKTKYKLIKKIDCASHSLLFLCNKY